MTRLALLVAMLVALVATTSGGRDANAGALDTTGTWTFSITGEFGVLGQQTIVCSADLVQTGNDVDADFECGLTNGSGEGSLTQGELGATIEADLMLNLSFPFPDIDAHAVGTISPNGNYMEGDWDADDYSGTFFANRQGGEFLNGDLNCDTSIDSYDALTAILHAAGAEVSQYPGCPEVGSQFSSIFGDVDCNNNVGASDAVRILQHIADVPLSAISGCPAVGATVVQGT